MKKLNFAVLATSLTAVSASSFAALPTEATTALTAVSTAVTDAEAAVWPVIGAMIVAGITIKLVKRFSSKI